MTEFRDRWRSRKFRNNGHACTSIVVQINTDDEKDGFELFTGTMMYFRVLLYVREFTEQHHFRTSGPGRSLPVDSGKSDLTRVRHLQNSTAKCMQESGRHDRPICHTTAQYSGYMHCAECMYRSTVLRAWQIGRSCLPDFG